jgi:aspartate carbamoyltransferase catalytic subunit
MTHLIDFSDLTREEWQKLYKLSLDIQNKPGDYRDALRGQTLASLFYEPSTRTRLSFEAAMLRLGGGVFGFSDPASSSVSKGETLKDTIVMVSGYADAVVMRHPNEGAALAASLYSSRPVINAGDGGHCHPTQTLTDLAALTKFYGSLDGLRIGLCGDLKYGRTAHSLLKALGRYRDISLTVISAPELALPEYAVKVCLDAGIKVSEGDSLRSAVGGLDVLYMTRVQKERFSSLDEYERLKDRYILTPEIMADAPRGMKVLHPLPRGGEIEESVDSDPRSVYFEQARGGMFIRMALLLEACGLSAGRTAAVGNPRHGGDSACSNKSCITHLEKYLPVLAGGGVCGYCESTISKSPASDEIS